MERIIIPNIQEYSQEIINGSLILTKRILSIDEGLIFTKNLRGSTIIECKINGDKKEINKYIKLILYIYSISKKETILENTTINISQKIIYDKGFNYYDYLGLSIQGVEARRALKEIINMIRINGYSMEMKIKLLNDEIINFTIDS